MRICDSSKHSKVNSNIFGSKKDSDRLGSRKKAQIVLIAFVDRLLESCKEPNRTKYRVAKKKSSLAFSSLLRNDDKYSKIIYISDVPNYNGSLSQNITILLKVISSCTIEGIELLRDRF